MDCRMDWTEGSLALDLCSPVISLDSPTIFRNFGNVDFLTPKWCAFGDRRPAGPGGLVRGDRGGCVLGPQCFPLKWPKNGQSRTGQMHCIRSETAIKQPYLRPAVELWQNGKKIPFDRAFQGFLFGRRTFPLNLLHFRDTLKKINSLKKNGQKSPQNGFFGDTKDGPEHKPGVLVTKTAYGGIERLHGSIWSGRHFQKQPVNLLRNFDFQSISPRRNCRVETGRGLTE